VRYGDGGGINGEARARREQIRYRAAGMFADGRSALEVAARLEISTKSAYLWRRTWLAGGVNALASKGPPGPDRALNPTQVQRLFTALQAGPATAGYIEDQRWTLARIAALIRTMFHRTLSLQAVSELLHREGWTPQQPIHHAAERDEQAIAHWRRYQWPAVKGSRAGWARGSASPTSPASR
jgi:transposase